MDHPTILYHNTPSTHRESIWERGLLRSCSETTELAREMGEEGVFGGIFMSAKPSAEREGFDTWAVDVSGLDILPDETTDCPDPEDSWWVCWDADIEADRLELLNTEPAPSP